ncbi:MAG: molybdate ABC transporter permease subunit [Bacillota bacterium]|nr:molybdate ABC transporter permease subunit [Bacillota bacterium]
MLANLNIYPLYLSLKVATAATILAIIIGLPIGWILARKSFPGKSILDSIITLPIVLPPTVLGYYLLVSIGRQSTIGQAIEQVFGVTLVFTWQAAVIASLLASIPLLIKSTKAAFGDIDQDIENAARTLGKGELSIFFRITIPLAWPGILSGVILSFARALGDFGTTLIVAGNIPGKTQTMPIAIYDALLAGDLQTVNFLVVLMTIVALIILVVLNRLDRLVVRGKRDA